jgi:hypothetical protein
MAQASEKSLPVAFHRELHSSLRECHIFLSLPADTTMASTQGTPFLAIHSADEHCMIYYFTNTTSYSTFYTFFSSCPITLWQTTTLFLSTTVTRTRRHTELTKKKLTKLTANLCCAREHSVQFFVQFFLHSYTAEFVAVINIWQRGRISVSFSYSDVDVLLPVNCFLLFLLLHFQDFCLRKWQVIKSKHSMEAQATQSSRPFKCCHKA